MSCFLLKRGLSFSESQIPWWPERVNVVSKSAQLPSRQQCLHMRIWLQDICSHPKTNLAQLKMSVRQRMQCCQAMQLVLYFKSTKFTQQCFVLKKSLKFTIMGFIYQSHMGLSPSLDIFVRPSQRRILRHLRFHGLEGNLEKYLSGR